MARKLTEAPRPRSKPMALVSGRKAEMPKAQPRPFFVRDDVRQRQNEARAQKDGARHKLPRSNVYVVTSAQSDTPVHDLFLESLKRYCKHRNAELVVIPFRYRNPTSLWTKEDEDHDVWAPELASHLFAGCVKLNDNVAVFGNVRLQPTAMAPLSSLEAMSHGMTSIFGHPKIQLKSIPTLPGDLPKLLVTTGAITTYNYTQSKQGAIGEFHHTIGAAVVEITGDTFHLRQLNADKTTGEFTDLTHHYTPTGVKKAPPPLALVMGDTHVDFISEEVRAATFDKGGVVDTLKPRHLIWHDLLDGYAINPHHKGNPFNALAKYEAGRDSIEDEINRACKFVRDNTPRYAKSVVVASNHDDFVRRWVLDTPLRDILPVNMKFHTRMRKVMEDNTKLTESGTSYPSPFIWLARRLMRAVKVLDGNESFNLGGVELGMHGDRGPNGARGSARNLRRIGTKSVIGHSHSPCIEEGCYQVGTSTNLQLEYNPGPSGWLNTHCILYANGKRTLVNVIKGEWRLT